MCKKGASVVFLLALLGRTRSALAVCRQTKKNQQLNNVPRRHRVAQQKYNEEWLLVAYSDQLAARQLAHTHTRAHKPSGKWAANTASRRKRQAGSQAAIWAFASHQENGRISVRMTDWPIGRTLVIVVRSERVACGAPHTRKVRVPNTFS